MARGYHTGEHSLGAFSAVVEACLLLCPSAWHIMRPSELPYVSWGNLPSDPAGAAVKVRTINPGYPAQWLLLFLLPQSQLKGGRLRRASWISLESSSLQLPNASVGCRADRLWLLGSGSRATNEREEREPLTYALGFFFPWQLVAPPTPALTGPWRNYSPHDAAGVPKVRHRFGTPWRWIRAPRRLSWS